MGWVVTRWRTDRLAALLDDETRESARRLLWEAERDAARVRSKAAGSAASAARELAAIERLGMDLRDGVRGFRAGEPAAEANLPTLDQGSDPWSSVATLNQGSEPCLRVEPDPPPALARRPRRGRGRASLHDSPLAEMMRAGAAR